MKYGRWTPKNKYNIDHVPLLFDVDHEKTCDITANEQFWVFRPSSGLDKSLVLKVTFADNKRRAFMKCAERRSMPSFISAPRNSYRQRVWKTDDGKNWRSKGEMA